MEMDDSSLTSTDATGVKNDTTREEMVKNSTGDEVVESGESGERGAGGGGKGGVEVDEMKVRKIVSFLIF